MEGIVMKVIQAFESLTKRIFYRFLNSKHSWDIFGGLYNRRILLLAADVYKNILDDIGEMTGSVLDVGCGPGLLTVMFAKRFPQAKIVGIDYSSTEVKAADEQSLREGITNCRFLTADAMDLPFGDESFDQVISTFSIKHWPDQEVGMKEIHRVLAPGGGALITEYRSDYSKKEYDDFIKLCKDFFGRFLWLLPTTWITIRWTVDQGLSLDQATELARKAGFREVEAKGIGGLPFIKLIMNK